MSPPLAVSIVLALAAAALLAFCLALRRRLAEAVRDGQAAQRERDLARAEGVLLRRSEARYRQVIESADDIIYQLDLEGRFLYANPAGLLAFGFSEAELPGHHYTETVRNLSLRSATASTSRPAQP